MGTASASPAQHDKGDSPIKSVADTAFMVAAYRALETARPQPLFRDSLAAVLGGEHAKKIITGLRGRMFFIGWSVVIRTVIIDEMIQSAVAEGIDTILNLGAGLDTRPYRMDLPASLLWIEADFPGVIDLKEERLKEQTPQCRLERVKVDLSNSEQRGRFLTETAARSEKILVLTEGVIPYLNPDEVASLAADLRARPVFRYWIADYFSPETYRYRRRKGVTDVMKNAPFRFEPEDYFGFFREHGWQPQTTRYLVEEGRRLNRPIPLRWPLRLWIRVLSLFMSPARRAAMGRFMGYVLFKPSETN